MRPSPRTPSRSRAPVSSAPKIRDDASYRVLILPDMHVPAHCPRAIATICAWAKTQRFDALVQLGDFLDFEAVSRFVKEQPKKLADGHILEEFAMGRRVFDQVTKAARTKNPNCARFMLEGNHEVRLKRFEAQHPMLRGMFDVAQHLGLKEDGRYVEADSKGELLRFEWRRPGTITPIVLDPSVYRSEMPFGLSCTHGWNHGVNAAKQHAERCPFPGVIVHGHSHARALATSDRWGGDQSWAVSAGWLGLLWPDYTKGAPTRWTQSFAVASLSYREPLVDVIVPRIRDGVMIAPDGTVFRSAA